MIVIIRVRATKEELDEMLQMWGAFIKIVVDIEREILTGGAEGHYECEQELLKDGSRQKDLWGADWCPYTAVIRRAIMPKWNAIEASFLNQSYSQQLGELAAGLARLKSWSQKSASREIVSVLLQENLLYVKLLQKRSHANNVELTQLQELLQGWVNQCGKSTEVANLAEISAAWSQRVLDMSGLLVTAESKTA